MNASFRVTNQDEIEMEMVIKMTLKKWKELQKQLPEEWSAWAFSAKITDMISHASEHFYPNEIKS